MEIRIEREDHTESRLRVVAEAMTWLGTPYHHRAMVKNVGVDCSMFLAGVYHAVGVMPAIHIAPYPHDWHMHKNRELYIEELSKHAVEIEGEPLPGDIVLWQFGRTFSHGAIVVKWPIIIHSYINSGVVREDVENAKWLAYIGENTGGKGKLRPMKFFRPKAWVL